MKHLELRQLFLQQLVLKRRVILRKVSTTSNTADLGTKPLSTKHLLDILAKLGYRLLDEMPLKTAFSCLIIGAKGEDVNLTAEEHNDGKFEAVFLFVMSMLVFIGLLCFSTWL